MVGGRWLVVGGRFSFPKKFPVCLGFSFVFISWLFLVKNTVMVVLSFSFCFFYAVCFSLFILFFIYSYFIYFPVLKQKQYFLLFS